MEDLSSQMASALDIVASDAVLESELVVLVMAVLVVLMTAVT